MTVSGLGVVNAFNSPPQTYLAPVAGDTYLSSDAPQATHGTSPVLWASHNATADDTILIQFNLLGKLRPGDLVVQATMRLTFVGGNAVEWPVPVVTGRTLTSWQENTTTYLSAPLLAFDTTTTTSVGTSTPPAVGSTVTIDVTKQIRRWHSYGGPSNFGTVIMIDSGVSQANLGFVSRENTQSAMPVLQVVYQPGPRAIYGYSLSLGPSSLVLARVE